MISTGTSSSSCQEQEEEDYSLDSPKASKRSAIFASPPEPLFNHVKTGLSPELIEKSLLYFLELNEKTLNQSTTLQDCFRTIDSTSFFFLACQHWKLPIDIQYRAVDLFVEFMSKHVSELYMYVQSTNSLSSPIDWEAVQNRLTHQVTLRALTCIQLASKVSLHYKIVSIDRARQFLSQCGFQFTANSLTQSEIRVLKTLDFQVHKPTLLDHIEIILEILGYNDPTIPVKQLHGLSIMILKVFYMTRREIEETLKQDVTSSKSITADTLLVSSSIVSTAAFLLNPSSSDPTVQAVSNIARIEPDDIIHFTSVLVRKIMTS